MINEIAFPKLGLQFKIDPVLFHYSFLGGGVHWYGVIIAFGIVLAVLYCMHVAKRENEDPEIIVDLLIYALPVSVITARTYYVIFSFDSYKDNLWDVFKIWEGGLAIYGGVIGAVLSAGIFFKLRKVNVLKLFDICCMGLLIGQAIGRWGNFVNAEAFGGPCDYLWGMSINGGACVHPTFLYESMWNIIGLIILSNINKHRPFYGLTFYSYLTWYGLGRFMIEGLRTDSLYWGSVRVSQALALICFVAGLIIIIFMTKKHKKMEKHP